MVVAAIIQHYIYMKSPCRDVNGYGYIEDCAPPDLTVWVQVSEFLTSRRRQGSSILYTVVATVD